MFTEIWKGWERNQEKGGAEINGKEKEERWQGIKKEVFSR
jgi:hypothetical protein